MILHIIPVDVEVNRQLVPACTLLDIEVLEHLLVGQQRHVSLRERGLDSEQHVKTWKETRYG